MTKLTDIRQTAKEIGLPVRTLRTLSYARKIPTIRLGHRTVWFDLEAVRAALAKFEVKEVGRAN